MTNQPRVSRPFLLYSSTVLAAGLALLLYSIVRVPPEVSVEAGLLLVAIIFSNVYSSSIASYKISLTYPLTMAGIILLGPSVAGLLAAAASIDVGDFKSGKPLPIMSFNLGQLVLISCGGSWVYGWLSGGKFGALSAADFPGILVPLALLSVLLAVANMLLTVIGSALLRGGRIVDLFGAMPSLLPTQVALAWVGFLIAQVLAVSPFALPLFIAPLVVAQQLYSRYVTLRDAFVDTMRSLVGALEAKDPYTRGHSERVAAYTTRLAESMGFDHSARDRLEYAALLHDVGKLRLPRHILVKPSRLTDEEYDEVQRHPAVGAEMIARIPPLRDLALLVESHHERFDGKGYPHHVESSEAPLGARILTVADCYDAMTTTRPYRPALSHEEAIAELSAGAGSQFDPEVVRQFIAAEIGVGQPPEPETVFEDDERGTPVVGSA